MSENKNNKMLMAIRSLIKTEIKKFLNENLQDLVKIKVNEILAEQFLSSLKEKKNSLTEVYNNNVSVVEKKSINENKQLVEQQRKDLRQKLLSKIQPEMTSLYEDVDINEQNDDDDEGIDPSIFMNRGG